MLYGVILGIHVLICIVLCLVVLLQSSKGSGLAGGGAAFGGGAEATVFGGRGAATFLSKATTIFGVAFMVTSLTLTLLGKASAGRAARSAVAEEARQGTLGIPAQTAPPTSPMPGAPGTTLPLGTPEGSGALPGGAAPAPAGAAAPGGTPSAGETGTVPPLPTPAPEGTVPSPDGG